MEDITITAWRLGAVGRALRFVRYYFLTDIMVLQWQWLIVGWCWCWCWCWSVLVLVGVGIYRLVLVDGVRPACRCRRRKGREFFHHTLFLPAISTVIFPLLPAIFSPPTFPPFSPPFNSLQFFLLDARRRRRHKKEPGAGA